MFHLSQFLLLAFSVLTVASSVGQIPNNLFNEVSEESYSPKDFKFSKSSVTQKVGVYNFGMSEGEWEFVLIPNGDSLIVQIWDGIWSTNIYTHEQCWQRQCKTFSNVSVQGDRIYFGNYSGIFADFIEEKKTTKSLLLFCDPIQGRNYVKDSAEVGFYSGRFEDLYDDNEQYELSLVVRPVGYFQGKTKQQLKIMRNTVYAKYGLIFQPGGEMEKYFKKKQWYNPFQKDVSNCLTEIEKKNIQTIASLEQTRIQ